MSMLSKRMCWIMVVTLVCVGQMAYGGAPPDLAASVSSNQGDGMRDATPIATGVDTTAAGYLMIAPDDFGSWASVGFGGGGDIFNPTGFATGLEATFSAGVFLFVGSSRRQLLTDNATYLAVTDDTSMDAVVSIHNSASDENGDGVDDCLRSTFSVSGGVDLSVDLTQCVYTIGGEGSGLSELEQVYTFTNASRSGTDIVLVSTYDGDFVWVGDFSDDSVGTETNSRAAHSAFEQEAGIPATRVEVRITGGSEYYGGRNGIDPDGGGLPFGFGTDVQIWEAFGVPDGSGGADASNWERHIAGVGYGTNGESGAAPADCGVPCDGFVGVQVRVAVPARGTGQVTIFHTYGELGPVCGDGACEGAEDECNCPGDCGDPPGSEDDCTDGEDNDCDGSTDCDDSDCADHPDCVGDPIPTVSEWGMIAIGLLTVVVGAIVFTRWRTVEPGAPDAS